MKNSKNELKFIYNVPLSKKEKFIERVMKYLVKFKKKNNKPISNATLKRELRECLMQNYKKS